MPNAVSSSGARRSCVPDAAPPPLSGESATYRWLRYVAQSPLDAAMGRTVTDRRGSGSEAELLQAGCVRLGEAGEHPADAGQVHPRMVDAADQHGAQRVALGDDRLRLAQRLAHEPATPEG